MSELYVHRRVNVNLRTNAEIDVTILRKYWQMACPAIAWAKKSQSSETVVLIRAAVEPMRCWLHISTDSGFAVKPPGFQRILHDSGGIIPASRGHVVGRSLTVEPQHVDGRLYAQYG